MPTSEAMDAAAKFLWPVYEDKNMPRSQFALGNDKCQRLALAFDRFAAQRGATITDRAGDYEAQAQVDAPPQTGGAFGLRDRPELTALIEKARAAYAAMSPEEREAHDIAQRESWVRGNIELDRLERQTTSMAQTGGGAAGERARALESLKKAGVAITTTDFVDALSAALRSTRREGEDALQRVADALGVDGISNDGLSIFIDGPGDREVAEYIEHIKETAHREGAEEARQDALRVPFTKALVAEARTQGYREGAEAMREACIASSDPQGDEAWERNAQWAATTIRDRLRALPLPGKTGE